MSKIPKSHPRYLSLTIRKKVEEGVEEGITSKAGLIAHGRGEAFDYLLGEKTNDFAKKAVDAAAAYLLLAKDPMISVNGNSAALSPRELAKLASLLNCPLEVNIFHASKKREKAIASHLKKNGAKKILLPQKKYSIKHLESNRKFVNGKGILKADVVFVPLEDGDRAEALIKNKKKVIAIDLNPLSRTARSSTITIVDNIVRALPLLIERISVFKQMEKSKLKEIAKKFNNKKNLRLAHQVMRKI